MLNSSSRDHNDYLDQSIAQRLQKIYTKGKWALKWWFLKVRVDQNNLEGLLKQIAKHHPHTHTLPQFLIQWFWNKALD